MCSRNECDNTKKIVFSAVATINMLIRDPPKGLFLIRAWPSNSINSETDYTILCRMFLENGSIY